LNVGSSYASNNQLIADPRIQVAHNTTPDHLHFPVGLNRRHANRV
jgi:predicted dehydrogenase